jgi:hypothetical protein
MTKRIPIAAAFFAVLAGAGVVHATSVSWTAGGSTGTIDEGDLAKIVLNNDGSAAIRSTIASTSAKIRFNLVDLHFPRFPGASAAGISIAYRDNGAGARVIATFKRVRVGQTESAGTLGKLDLLATIDSDLRPASNGWQEANVLLRQVDATCCGEGLVFPDFAYIFEVQLIKHDATGNPAVLGVQVGQGFE